MEEIDAIIARTPLFSGLAPQQVSQLQQIAVRQSRKRGAIIFSDGDPGSGFYVVVHGQVKISKISTEGKEQILHIFGPGHPFGEAAVFAGQNYPATAQAIADSSLLFFGRQVFSTLIARNPSLALNMLAVLSRRLRQFTDQIENLALKEVPARLASYLIYQAAEQKAHDEVALNISKGQLASLLGTIPETLSRIFAKMSDQDLIAVHGRHIRLIDRPGLAELALYGRRMDG